MLTGNRQAIVPPAHDCVNVNIWIRATPVNLASQDWQITKIGQIMKQCLTWMRMVITPMVLPDACHHSQQ
jgi:hypothetical protein